MRNAQIGQQSQPLADLTVLLGDYQIDRGVGNGKCCVRWATGEKHAIGVAIRKGSGRGSPFRIVAGKDQHCSGWIHATCFPAQILS
jgi:hypothetical protein